MNKRTVGILGTKLDKILIVFVLLAICAITNVFGRDAFSQETGIRRHGPPPEAYEACEDKSVGEEAEFINRRGNTVTGTCKEEGDQLVLRPDNPKGRFGGRRHGPPPEAYEACEDKSAGDEAEFINPRGETVTGICKEEGDQLVLRPDNPKGRFGGRRHGPPPEAYEACEDKSAGDEAEFVNRRGETVTGTCQQRGDQLVLRPDCPKEDSDGTAMRNLND